MAKQAREGGSIESGFDFSKFLDLDDDELIVSSADDADQDYQTIPHSREEVVTGALHLDLEGSVESYIKAGKVSWGDKRALRRLASENSELEAELKVTDEALLERAVNYHGLVSTILREKDGLSVYTMDDSDPYDSESVGSDSKPLGSAEARTKSSEIFHEIEKLEAHRTELNGQRIAAIGEIRDIAAKHENGGWEPLDSLLEEKLVAIERIQPITKVQFSEEDEANFEQDLGELTGYIEGSFDPLADEDEYDEDSSVNTSEETPLSSDGHSDEELLAMKENASSEPTDQSFTELFGVDEALEDDSELDGGLDEDLEPVDAAGGDEFSSEESIEDLDAALGEGYVAEPVDHSDDLELSDAQEYLGDYPTAEDETVADDLSAAPVEADEHSADVESLDETASWDGSEDDEHIPATEFLDSAPDEIASDVVSDLEHDRSDYFVSDEDEFELEQPLDKEASEELSEDEELDGPLPAEVAAESDAIPSSYADFSGAGVTVRTVIFDELKAKYGISFEGVPGLED